MPKKTATKKPVRCVGSESIVVQSKVKDYLKSLGMRSDGDLVGSLSDHTKAVLRNAVARAKAGGRSTVRPTDL
jgi:histone H3/H4